MANYATDGLHKFGIIEKYYFRMGYTTASILKLRARELLVGNRHRRH